MTFIEGIGDEVTAVFVVLIIIVLATLVTFIGSGSHLYTPTHTPVLPTPQNVTSETDQITEPPITNLNSTEGTPYSTLTVNFSNHTSTFYPGDQLQEQDVSDDTEEQSSSDEVIRAPATSGDAPDLETPLPTAPAEETVTENTGGQNTDSNIEGSIRIRLKYLDDTERLVRSSLKTKIVDFKRLHFSEDLANNKIVRLIFCGHLLRDNSTLESYRVLDNSVLHVQILQAQTEQNRTPVTQNTELDLSHLLWPLVSVVLGVCWVFYFKYPEFFSVISLSLLFIFTASFFVFYTHVHQ